MPPAPLQMMPTDADAAYPPTKPSNCHLTTPTATPFMPMQTRMEWLLSNLREPYLVLWTPDTIYRHCTQSWLGKPHETPAHPIKPVANIPCLSVHLPYHTNTSLANYATSPYNPAFDLYPTLFNHSQKCPQHHLLLADKATRPYNPALDVHLMRTKYHQKCNQTHTRLPLATHVPVFAQNKQPP